MRLKSYLSLVLGLTTFCGCQHDILSKRQSELCCPTDIRQKHPFRWGEDAILHSPCGPDAEFYGLKPTSWRLWPTSGAQWRDTYCDPITEAESWSDYDSEIDDDRVIDHNLLQPEKIGNPDLSNPFRDDPKVIPEPEKIDPSITSSEFSQIEPSIDSLSASFPEDDYEHRQRRPSSQTRRAPTQTRRTVQEKLQRARDRALAPRPSR